VANVEWDPESYMATMLAEVPGYDELQEHVVAATRGIPAESVLELGIGTGETARRVLALHPHARWTAIDASPQMLARARRQFPGADLRLGRLEDPLPEGPFDLVVSALAVHHLDAAGKSSLFRRVADVLRPSGRFVLGDVVVPERAEDARIGIDWVVDLPDRVDDQLDWLREAGLTPTVVWAHADLAVVRADR
jgi:tRNA (cmo5U34)-methyltransferase